MKNSPGDKETDKAYCAVDDAVGAIAKEFAIIDGIMSQVAAYGSCEYEAGFIAGYKAATRLITAGLQD